MRKPTDESSSNKDDPKMTSVDTNSVYYIHVSDYPKQMHVNALLNDNNYSDWFQEMEFFLFATSKIGLVDGTISMPSEDTKNLMF